MAEKTISVGEYADLTEDDVKSELKMLKSSWEMYEKTKQETFERRNNMIDKSGNKIYSEKSTSKTMELLEKMQDDIKQKYLSLGGKIEDLVVENKSRNKKMSKNKLKEIQEAYERELENIKASTPVNTNEKNEGGSAVTEKSFFSESLTNENSVENSEDIGTIDDTYISVDVSRAKGNTIKYDIIPLPSKGQCYKNKMAKIPVGYLTAYDENMIISPNMYRDGSFLDHILEAKIMTNEIDQSELLPGDRDAIILWLRASGYGNEFPVSATDNNSGKQFDTVVDLTQLKYKKFTLKGDANGYFDFTLPVSKDAIKFKFLTYGDIKRLDKMEEDEILYIKRSRVLDVADTITDIIDDAKNDIDAELMAKLRDAAKSVREYAETIADDEKEMLYSHSVTNRLAASIMSINGVTDRKYIEEYVTYMNVMDSSSLRKYMTENEPGIDFRVTVERPKSLGGGSIELFLSLDQYLFLSVAQ